MLFDLALIEEVQDTRPTICREDRVVVSPSAAALLPRSEALEL